MVQHRAEGAIESTWSRQRKRAASSSATGKPDNAALFSRYFENRTERNRNTIAIANDRLALDIAHRYKNISPVPLEDLAQIARMGLLKAIEKYDRAHGAAFSSFAVPYIRGEILHYLRDDNPDLINIPRRWREDRAKVRAEHARWLAAGYDLTEAEIAERCFNLNREKWEEIVHATSRQTVFQIEESHCASDPIEEVLADDETRAMIRRAIAALPKKLRQCVFDLHYGRLTVEAIARRYKMSREEVEQAIKQGQNKMRSSLRLEISRPAVSVEESVYRE